MDALEEVVVGLVLALAAEVVAAADVVPGEAAVVVPAGVVPAPVAGGAAPDELEVAPRQLVVPP